jgi:hypothetical protein
MKPIRPNVLLRSSAPIVLSACAALIAAGCGSPSNTTEISSPHPGRVDLSTDITTNATVVAIDSEKRLIMLRREDESIFTVDASKAIGSISRIGVGDALRVHYHESLSATLVSSGGTTSPVDAALVAGSSDKPPTGVGLRATARVRIESVDRTNNIVVFSHASGELNTVKAQRPMAQTFVQSLEIGDIVQLEYAVSTALEVEKL